MRALLFLASAVVVSSHSTANAQQTAGSEVDFFGIYAPPVYDGGGPPRTEPDVMPFTREGQRASDAYVPARDNPRILDDCAAETMPRIVWSGNPMEVLEQAGDLVIRYERGNTVRSIDMSGTPPAANRPHTDLGYSVGYWVGDVLTIETTRMSSGAINNGDRPLSREGRVTERYWREPGENDLQLELEIDDPVYYAETFKMGREFVWAPEEQLRPWECISLGPQDTPPDIDELARMLEEL